MDPRVQATAEAMYAERLSQDASRAAQLGLRTPVDSDASRVTMADHHSAPSPQGSQPSQGVVSSVPETRATISPNHASRCDTSSTQNAGVQSVSNQAPQAQVARVKTSLNQVPQDTPLPSAEELMPPPPRPALPGPPPLPATTAAQSTAEQFWSSENNEPFTGFNAVPPPSPSSTPRVNEVSGIKRKRPAAEAAGEIRAPAKRPSLSAQPSISPIKPSASIKPSISSIKSSVIAKLSMPAQSSISSKPIPSARPQQSNGTQKTDGITQSTTRTQPSLPTKTPLPPQPAPATNVRPQTPFSFKLPPTPAKPANQTQGVTPKKTNVLHQDVSSTPKQTSTPRQDASSTPKKPDTLRQDVITPKKAIAPRPNVSVTPKKPIAPRPSTSTPQKGYAGGAQPGLQYISIAPPIFTPPKSLPRPV